MEIFSSAPLPLVRELKLIEHDIDETMRLLAAVQLGTFLEDHDSLKRLLTFLALSFDVG